MNDRPPVRAIVLGHGTMPQGLVDAVRRITGVPGDAIVPLTNEGLATEAVCAEVDRIAGESPALVFVDLQSGSCALAARIACRGEPRRAALFGVNLPVLLDFVFHREMELDELVDRLVEKGRAAITGAAGGGTSGVDESRSGSGRSSGDRG